MLITKIISGGQTGADLGGLVAGRKLAIRTGGVAPLGYRTELGPQRDILFGFGLFESHTHDYRVRTADNIRHSDGTLIVADKPSSPGTRMTISFCKDYQKPYILNPTAPQLQAWLAAHAISVLNVAGNRESVAPGIALKTANLLLAALATTPTTENQS